MITWVVGRGGLLGRSVERALDESGSVWHPRRSFSWGDEARARVELGIAAREFASYVAGTPWQVAWCAGTGTVGTHRSVLGSELASLSALLTELANAFGSNVTEGAIFLAVLGGRRLCGRRRAALLRRLRVAPSWNTAGRNLNKKKSQLDGAWAPACRYLSAACQISTAPGRISRNVKG